MQIKQNQMSLIILLSTVSENSNIQIIIAIIASIGGLSGIISPIIVGLFNARSKRKEREFKDKMDLRDEKRDIELKERDEKAQAKLNKVVEILNEKVDYLTHTINKVDDTVNKLVDDKILEKNFIKYTIGITDKFLEKNLVIHDFYKSAINMWGHLIKEMIKNYYFSPSRNESKQDRRRLVTDQKKRVLRAFESMIDSNDSIRLFKGAKVKFSGFLRKENAYASFESLCVDLEQNGLDNKELLERVGEQVDKFSELIITSSVIWERLEVPKVKEHEI